MYVYFFFFFFFVFAFDDLIFKFYTFYINHTKNSVFIYIVVFD